MNNTIRQKKSTKWLPYFVAVVLATACAGCGLFSSGRAPGPCDFTEEDVRNFMKAGRPLAEITNRFGKATLVRTNGIYSVWHFWSGLPDTHPRQTVVIFGEPGYVFAGFNLWTTNGLATRWGESSWEKTNTSGSFFSELRRIRRLHKSVGRFVEQYLVDQPSTGCCAFVVGYPFTANIGKVDDGVTKTAILALTSNGLSRVSSAQFPTPYGVNFMTATGTLKGSKGMAGVTVLITAGENGEDVKVERVDIGPYQSLK